MWVIGRLQQGVANWELIDALLRKAKKIDRVQDGDDRIWVGRVATYVVARTLIRFGK